MSLINRFEPLERRVMLSGVAFTQSEVELRDVDFVDTVETAGLLLVGEIDDPSQIRSNLSFADLDLDGDDDLLFVAEDSTAPSGETAALYVGENEGKKQYRVSRVSPLSGVGALPYGVELGNLNQDELIDVVVANFGTADPFEENVTLFTSRSGNRRF